MHALVTTVLLWSACLNPFVNNPKLHPAEREFRKSHEPRARERRAVVGPDSSGHSVLPHSCFTDCSNLAKVDARHDLATNQITGIRIGNRKRIAKTIAAKPKLVQISTAYGQRKDGSATLPRNKYVEVRPDNPTSKEEATRPEFKTCKYTTEAIVSEGIDKGEIRKVCTELTCDEA